MGALFNLVEGVINHHLLGLHHVMEYVPDKRPADLAFLASGLVSIAAGVGIVRAGRHHASPRGRAAGPSGE